MSDIPESFDVREALQVVVRPLCDTFVKKGSKRVKTREVKDRLKRLKKIGVPIPDHRGLEPNELRDFYIVIRDQIIRESRAGTRTYDLRAGPNNESFSYSP